MLHNYKIYLHTNFCFNVSVCHKIQQAIYQPFRTFIALPAEIPDVRVLRSTRHVGVLKLAARGEWIIGWVYKNHVLPIYNEQSKIICKNIHTKSTLTFEDNDPFIKELGIYGFLPAGTPHTLQFLRPEYPIKKKASILLNGYH